MVKLTIDGTVANHIQLQAAAQDRCASASWPKIVTVSARKAWSADQVLYTCWPRMKLTLHILICSTRPTRVGPSVARWFHGFALKHGKFDAVLVDVNDFELPIFDEPYHPTLCKYQHEHTKRWSASVAAADAYVFVTPEYNYCPPPAFVNALDYVYREWNYKPCGFVSYGGFSGGVRAVQLEKQLVTTLKMMPMMEGVVVPMIAQMLDERKALKANQLIEAAATKMLDELLLWAEALKPLRERVKESTK